MIFSIKPGDRIYNKDDNNGTTAAFKKTYPYHRKLKHLTQIARIRYTVPRFPKGSAAELRTQIYIAQRIGILTPSNKDKLVLELKEISAMLQGLINSHKKHT